MCNLLFLFLIVHKKITIIIVPRTMGTFLLTKVGDSGTSPQWQVENIV